MLKPRQFLITFALWVVLISVIVTCSPINYQLNKVNKRSSTSIFEREPTKSVPQKRKIIPIHTGIPMDKNPNPLDELIASRTGSSMPAPTPPTP
ncbi:hypothetical protein C1645_871544 [Glomus cerebriforme]|uniref:Uncharacterized protein n=1 Tax=Glomus cerebriforme TaxID=658196 RepID=A0A397TQM0_9GLOM|nr:hypothetical protein C1645_871544 [Glomus cerebriforme]